MDLKKINKKLMIIGLGGVVLIAIIIIIISLTTKRILSYSKIEEKMKQAAINYYKDNPSLLPQTESGKVTIGANDLETKYLKSLSEMVKDGVICNGEVRVIKNEGHYLYIPYLNCGNEYSTNELYKNVSQESNVVTSGDGLYKVNNEFIFRGEKVNNYVKFAGKNWRIIKITESGQIKLIEEERREAVPWDDRYNEEKQYNIGFNNFKVSRVFESLKDIYNSDEFSDSAKANIVSQELCIGKRTETDSTNDGSIECSAKSESIPLGLLQINEYVSASLDSNCKKIEDASCQNYNYLHSYDKIFWTITADKNTSYRVYRIDSSGVKIANASVYSIPRLTLNINDSVIYKSGNGSIENPYVID